MHRDQHNLQALIRVRVGRFKAADSASPPEVYRTTTYRILQCVICDDTREGAPLNRPPTVQATRKTRTLPDNTWTCQLSEPLELQ